MLFFRRRHRIPRPSPDRQPLAEPRPTFFGCSQTSLCSFSRCSWCHARPTSLYFRLPGHDRQGRPSMCAQEPRGRVWGCIRVYFPCLYENLLYRLYFIRIQPARLVTARLSGYTAYTAHTAIQPYTPYIIQRYTASLRLLCVVARSNAAGRIEPLIKYL